MTTATTNEAWRPGSLSEFVGQRGLVDLLQDEVDAAAAERRPVAHMLLYGPPGLGKTTVPDAVARALGRPVHTVMGPAVTEELLSDLLGELDPAGYDGRGFVRDRDRVVCPFLVIDECEEVPRRIWELLHPVLEPAADGRCIFSAKRPGRTQRTRIWVPHLTVVAITNYYGKLRKNAMAAMDRFPIKWAMQPYADGEIAALLRQYADRADIYVQDAACDAIAARSMGTPRNAIALLRQARTRALALARRGLIADLTITPEIAGESAGLLSLDDAGLPQTHRSYLAAVAKANGRVGLPSLAATLCVDEETIRADVEPDLIRKGLVAIVPGGRQLTDAGLAYVGPENASPLLARRVD